jgi:solute carrier family 45 protein 1/2/4
MRKNISSESLILHPDMTNERDDDKNLSQERRISLCSLINLAISMLGISFCWGCQFGRASATFQALGLSHELLGVAWLAGPISGIIISPLVGTASDHWKKRKPFMLIGLFGIAFSFAVFANAIDIVLLFGGDISDALLLAIVMFWVGDFAINMIQTPLRALLVDIAPPSQQTLGNSLLSVMQGIGNLLVFSFGGFHVGSWFPFLKGSSGTDLLWDIRVIYILGIVCVLFCVGWTLCFVKEPALSRAIRDITSEAESQSQDQEESESPMSVGFLHRVWFGFPRELRNVCVLQLFVWYSWFSYLVYLVPYVGVTLFEGAAASEEYNRGVRLANAGLAINSGVTMLSSFVLGQTSGRLRCKRVYQVCLLVQLMLMLWLLFLRPGCESELLACLGMFGVPWAAALILPYSIAGRCCQDSHSRGASMSLLNVSICLPQIMVSASSALLLKLAAGDLRVMFIASIVSLSIGCLLTPHLLN